MIEKSLLERLGFTDEDKKIILNAEKNNSSAIEKIAVDFWEKGASFPHCLKKVRKTDKILSPYTLDLLFILHLTSFLKEEYIRRNISEEIYWDTVKDIKFKADECRAVYDTVGTFVAEWFEGFFRLTRFSFGRLQFDALNANEKIKAKTKTVEKGDFILSCHIPSGSRLSYDECISAYKKAYEFFSDQFEGELAIICISWLLYPEYKKIFDNCSNTKRFIEDYQIYKVKAQLTFEDAWRVFNTNDYSSVEALCNKTSMQRGFIEHIKNKGKFGYAFGVLLFDGERVL